MRRSFDYNINLGDVAFPKKGSSAFEDCFGWGVEDGVAATGSFKNVGHQWDLKIS